MGQPPVGNIRHGTTIRLTEAIEGQCGRFELFAIEALG